jgi:hypothetical protein
LGEEWRWRLGEEGTRRATIADDMPGMPTATKIERPRELLDEQRGWSPCRYSSERVNARADEPHRERPVSGADGHEGMGFFHVHVSLAP